MKTIAKDEFHDLLCRMADAATLKGKDMTPEPENDWVEYDPHDLKTHPKEGALVEAQYESGRHGEATYSHECGGFSTTFRFGETPDETTVKRWRYK
jgi:hypothetical protein